MSDPAGGFTASSLLASATEVLVTNGYHQVQGLATSWETSTSRLFEDEFNIVGVAVFESCSDLINAWSDIQGSLVDTISKRVAKSDSKAWDGYLVLLTPGLAPSSIVDVDAIKYNTTRLRKLVATGDDLRSVADVDRILRPLLPFVSEQTSVSSESVLDALPSLLKNNGIPEKTTKVLVDAFQAQASLMDRLHDQRESD